MDRRQPPLAGICVPGTLKNMSKGIGKTQRVILDLLPDAVVVKGGNVIRPAVTSDKIAMRLNISPRQVNRAVHSLAERGMVELTLTRTSGLFHKNALTLQVWKAGALGHYLSALQQHQPEYYEAIQTASAMMDDAIARYPDAPQRFLGFRYTLIP
jgi:hypothetical protein